MPTHLEHQGQHAPAVTCAFEGTTKNFVVEQQGLLINVTSGVKIEMVTSRNQSKVPERAQTTTPDGVTHRRNC